MRIFCTKYSTNILVSSKTVRNDLKKCYSAFMKSYLIKHVVDVPNLNKIKSLKYLKKI